MLFSQNFCCFRICSDFIDKLFASLQLLSSAHQRSSFSIFSVPFLFFDPNHPSCFLQYHSQQICFLNSVQVKLSCWLLDSPIPHSICPTPCSHWLLVFSNTLSKQSLLVEEKGNFSYCYDENFWGKNKTSWTYCKSRKMSVERQGQNVKPRRFREI